MKNAQRLKPPRSLVHVFADNFEDDWVETADNLCRLLKLPDLTTRSGLKKVHSNLSEIQQLLDDTFSYAKSTGQTKVMGAVIAIYTKMCVEDYVLQTKILEKGFYGHLMSLVDEDDTRHIALRALNSICFTAGKHVPASFSRGAPAILKHALKHLDDPTTLTIITGIFAHGASAARSLGRSFDIVALVRALLDALKGPHATSYMFSHAMVCFTASAYNTVNACEHMYPFVTLMAALLRSEDIVLRCQAVYNLRIMKLKDRDSSGNEIPDPSPTAMQTCCPNTSSLATSLKLDELPEALQKAAEKYGRERLFMAQMQRGNAAYTALFLQYRLDTDVLTIARELARLTYDYQYALPTALCPCCGDLAACEHCIPRRPWAEAARRGIEALRENSSSKQDALYADILQWKLICHDDETKLHDFCKSALERHPQCPLFYYLPTPFNKRKLTPETRLCFAKKGLKCPDIPEWLRVALTGVAVQAMWSLAMNQVEQTSHGHSNIEPTVVYPFIACARSDAKWILENGPPDQFNRYTHLITYILSHILIEGSGTNFKAPSIRRAMKELDINADFLRFYGDPVDTYPTSLRHIKNLAEAYRKGTKEWASLLTLLEKWYPKDSHHSGSKVAEEAVEDSLWQWVNKFEDGNAALETHIEPPQPRMVLIARSMMTCSWCARPSAALKKCAGCGQEKYCDAECQRLHWKTHREQCRKVKRVESAIAPQP